MHRRRVPVSFSSQRRTRQSNCSANELSVDIASGVPWANDTLWAYLEALARWLTDAAGYYFNNGRIHPGDGWVILADAFRCATNYE